MSLSVNNFIEALKIVSGVAIFFVWVVRYDNIKKEFQDYQLPTWLRDLVGILKISFAVMLQFPNQQLAIIGASGITLLMLGAVTTHIRLKSPFRKYIASVAMLTISSLIFYYIIA